MSIADQPTTRDCNCLAIRQAARHVTQFYDQLLAPSGLRTTQFSILGRLQRLGPMPINALAAELVMDRTTLGRNILPLQRDGLIEIGTAPTDRRRRSLGEAPISISPSRSKGRMLRPSVVRSMTSAAASALIGIGPPRCSRLRMANCVVRSPLSASNWS